MPYFQVKPEEQVAPHDVSMCVCACEFILCPCEGQEKGALKNFFKRKQNSGVKSCRATEAVTGPEPVMDAQHGHAVGCGRFCSRAPFGD